jgi:aerobic carbon-monoxide dehydrogenase small subunit
MSETSTTTGAPDTVAVALTVNGQAHEAVVEPRRTLADLLRESLGLTGTHLGCEHGVCGACTVILDDEPVRSCLVLAVQARGSSVTTIEGLAVGPDQLHPVQQACLECLSFQCGFCTPGFLMAAVAYLGELERAGAAVPSDPEIREAMSGNLCRCTGYQTIIDGIRLAAERTIGGNPDAAPAHATGGH